MRAYRFIDYATQAYLLLVGALVLLFHNETVPQWRWLVLGHFGLAAMIHKMIMLHATHRHGPLLTFVRHFYPILLYVPIYNETGHLNQMFASGMLDPWFIRWEDKLFGGQPSLQFMERLPYLWVSEMFYIAYFSYYLMITGCGLALYRQDRRQFFHYIALVSVVFYACFLTYIFLPVVGPRIFYRDFGDFDLPAEVRPAQVPEFPAAVQKGLFYQIMAIIYHHFETPGAAFPSSHVAVAVTTLYFSFRYLRPFRWVHAVVVFLLCLSTVYCRYHYAVDVPAGLFIAALMIWAGNRLIQRWEGPEGLPNHRPVPDKEKS